MTFAHPRARGAVAPRGFTLIELLIVVAIIAVLVAIAVPNFLEAQTRSKVSRAKADLRTMATAMEAYAVDNNAPPPAFGPTGTFVFPWTSGVAVTENLHDRFHWVTSPVAYLSGTLRDPFTVAGSPIPAWQQYLVIWSEPMFRSGFFSGKTQEQVFVEQSWRGIRPLWVLFSAGPDRDHDVPDAEFATLGIQDYDATNGTVSDGNIMRHRD